MKKQHLQNEMTKQRWCATKRPLTVGFTTELTDATSIKKLIQLSNWQYVHLNNFIATAADAMQNIHMQLWMVQEMKDLVNQLHVIRSVKNKGWWLRTERARAHMWVMTSEFQRTVNCGETQLFLLTFVQELPHTAWSWRGWC